MISLKVIFDNSQTGSKNAIFKTMDQITNLKNVWAFYDKYQLSIEFMARYLIFKLYQ